MAYLPYPVLVPCLVHDALFCKLHLPCIKSVIRSYNKVNFRVKVNLGQSSCYFDLRSNFNLTFRGKKVYVSMHLEERSAMVLKLFRYLSKLESFFAKNDPQIALFYFDPIWRGQGMTKRGQLGYHWIQNIPRICLASLSQFYPK